LELLEPVLGEREIRGSAFAQPGELVVNREVLGIPFTLVNFPAILAA